MAGGQQQVLHICGADEGRAVGCHRAQAAPEGGLADIAASREQVGHDVVQRAAARLAQVQAVTREFCGTANTDAVAQACDCHLVRLVHDGGLGRVLGVGDGHRDRIALDWVNRDADAHRRQQLR